METIVVTLRLHRDDGLGEDQEPYQNAWRVEVPSIGDPEDREWILRVFRELAITL